MKKLIFLLVSVPFFVFIGCRDAAIVPGDVVTSVLDTSAHNYTSLDGLPDFFLSNLSNYTFESVTEIDDISLLNPITDAGAALGRVLFYDKALSADGTISCASCHKQSNAFASSNSKDIGIIGDSLSRNSISLLNNRFNSRGKYFYDERAEDMETAVMLPLFDHAEMGTSAELLVNTVSSKPYYNELFANAFGSQEVSTIRISKALSQFLRSMVSYQSKYDLGRPEVLTPLMNFPNFSESENNGKKLFFLEIGSGGVGCVSCHTSAAFVDSEQPSNNGLDLNTSTDQGIGNGAFKTATLRNIELTAPYMHDGRFSTLEQVVEHYNAGVKNHPFLDFRLRQGYSGNGTPVKLNMTPQHKADLVAFLKTLTDLNIADNPKWSDPFE
jgi:cytochrome c peroxidase